MERSQQRDATVTVERELPQAELLDSVLDASTARASAQRQRMLNMDANQPARELRCSCGKTGYFVCHPLEVL
jgi:hypothetical protein